MVQQNQVPQPAPVPAGIGQHLGRARGMLESAAGIGVITAALYLLGVVHEQAFFSRFGIRPLYLDAPASTYVFRGAPAIVTVVFAAYLVYLFRTMGVVVASVARRGFRASLATFFRPHPGEVQRKGQILSFIAARLSFALLVLSPWILLIASDMVLRLALDELSLWLALFMAIAFVRWGNIRGAVLRHVPEGNRRSIEYVLLFSTIFGIALIAAQRTGEHASWRLVTGEAGEIVQVRFQLRPELERSVPSGDLFVVSMTDDNFYVMQRQCPPPAHPHVFAIPRTNIAAAELWSVDPTPQPLPGVAIPAPFVPRMFCWDPADFEEED